MKINDDFGQGLQMVFVDNCVSAVPMTVEEKRESLLPEHLTQNALQAALGTPQYVEAHWARDHALGQIRKQQEKEEREEKEAWAKFYPRPARHRRYRR